MKGCYRLSAALTTFLALTASFLHAQETPTPDVIGGREFWVVFQKNFRDWVPDEANGSLRRADPLQLQLFIASSRNARVTIDIPGLGTRNHYNVPAGSVIAIPIDTAVQIRSSMQIEKLGVHITSDEPVAVYGLNRRYQTTDTYLAYPVEALGTRYRAIGYKWLQNDLLSQFAIVATEDNTRITITPSVETRQTEKPAVVKQPARPSVKTQDLSEGRAKRKSSRREAIAIKKEKREKSIRKPAASVQIIDGAVPEEKSEHVTEVSRETREVSLELKRVPSMKSDETLPSVEQMKRELAEFLVRRIVIWNSTQIPGDEALIASLDARVDTLRARVGEAAYKEVSDALLRNILNAADYGADLNAIGQARIEVVEVASSSRVSTMSPQTLQPRLIDTTSFGWLTSPLPDDEAGFTAPSPRSQPPIEIVLNKGDVYQVIPKFSASGSSDITGSLIVSDKPIALFSGHNCAYVPDPKVKACNLLVEQVPPVGSWGEDFIVGSLHSRSDYVIRVLASEDSTQVITNGHLVAKLHAGEFYETDATGSISVRSSKPVLVAQYSKGFDNGDDIGDPMMILVSPTDQYATTYRFATPVKGSWHHYINVIAKTDELVTIRLDGLPIDIAKFTAIPSTSFSTATIELGYGTHELTSLAPVGLYGYGFGYDEAAYDAYGNSGGYLMTRPISAPKPIEEKLGEEKSEDVRLDPNEKKQKPVEKNDGTDLTPEKIER